MDRSAPARYLRRVISDAQWVALQHAATCELAFPPPFQLKLAQATEPYPAVFESDVDYWGDWGDECLTPFADIEWMRVRPRYLRHRGRLVPPEVVDIDEAFVAVLERLRIPYARDGGSIRIPGGP